MTIKLYDEVKLKDGREAHIVEIYEQGVAYEADIKLPDGEYDTDTVKHEEIMEILSNKD